MIRMYLRACAFAVALFALYVFSGPVAVWAQSGQQVAIGELQRRANANDALVQNLEQRVGENASAISEIQGEARVFFAVISVLTGGSFVGQVVVQISNRSKTHE